MEYLLIIACVCLLLTVMVAIAMFIIGSNKLAERNAIIDGLLKINDEQKQELIELRQQHGYLPDPKVKVRIEHHPAQNSASVKDNAMLGLLLGMQMRR